MTNKNRSGIVQGHQSKATPNTKNKSVLHSPPFDFSLNFPYFLSWSSLFPYPSQPYPPAAMYYSARHYLHRQTLLYLFCLHSVKDEANKTRFLQAQIQHCRPYVDSFRLSSTSEVFYIHSGSNNPRKSANYVHAQLQSPNSTLPSCMSVILLCNALPTGPNPPSCSGILISG